MNNFTGEDVQEFSDKITEGFNKVVPKHLRNDKNINKKKEKSYTVWVDKLRNRLKF